MSKEVLDKDGLLYLWAKVKSFVAEKVEELKTSISWDDILDKPDMSSLYEYKGSVATKEDLTAKEEGAKVGDTYNVEVDGMNYAWDGKAWDALGSTFTIETISNDEIDAITGS